MNPLSGALKLAGAMVLADLVVVSAVSLGSFAFVPMAIGDPGWLSEWFGGTALVVLYRTISGQPLFLLVLLRLFRQRLDAFSPTLVAALSLAGSLMAIYVLGFLFGSPPQGFARAGLSETLSGAGGFFMDTLVRVSPSENPLLAILSGLLLSPWIVLAIRTIWRRRSKKGE